MNANDLLDYFGSTVNIAARVQNESVGGDIVVTPEVLGDPGVRQVLRREDVVLETFQRELKGFSQEFTLTRLWLRAGARAPRSCADTGDGIVHFPGALRPCTRGVFAAET